MVKEVAALLKAHGAVQFGNFVLASGAKSSYYLDIKSAITDPILLREIGEAFAGRFSFDVVAGVAVGAVPLAVATSLASDKPYAIIRKEEKSHGKSGLIIGDVEGKTVLLVEDVTTSGGSALFGVRALREVGAEVVAVAVVVDRESGAAATFAGEGVALVPLTTVSEIMDL
ncbi:orotate phosphoribosyltransferase [Methanofollis aquaemaris]|uniref:Orotate phosphoribosyltransferase n=1 Tax=Methanofollis aquaemaris TaxID=126734 RepID=A0A8A3S8F1_9EURY|nr:orotate phosphoribosyltransferase [Methanofollis aquaemaris]QSZ68312.1 orotate phosphoribosyltransferase [Methanofollis aquaemaris]